MNAFFERLGKAEVVVAAAFLMFTVFAIFGAAISRSFGYPINWALDIALLLFTWCVFLLSLIHI